MSFGSTTAPTRARALAYAREHADRLEESGGTVRATFVLEGDESGLGVAFALVSMVQGWRSTLVESGGAPEQIGSVYAMLTCAWEWARSGGCRERFPPRIPAKCRICPLYDPEWALEAPPEAPVWRIGSSEEQEEIPDHLPEDWT